MSTPSVLVTGATGCIGLSVVATAQQRGWKVRGLARRPPGRTWPSNIDFVLADVRDHAAVARAGQGCDAIVHLAGWVHRVPRNDNDLTELRTSIVDGSRVVAEAAAAGNARLVSISSIAVYGHGFATDKPPRPETPYGRAKLEAEEVVRTVCPSGVILRPALVYGPHDHGNVARLIKLIDRRLGLIVGDGTNRKAMVYVDNLADRILESITRPDLSGAWIAADDPAPTQAELVGEISRALGRRKPPSLPSWPLTFAASAVDRISGSHWRDRVTSLSRSTDFPGAPLDDALGYAPRVRWPDGIHTQVQQWISA